MFNLVLVNIGPHGKPHPKRTQKKNLGEPNNMGPNFLFKEYWRVVGDNISIMKNVLSTIQLEVSKKQKKTIQLELLGFSKK